MGIILIKGASKMRHVHPLRILGIVFTAVAAVELVVLLVLLDIFLGADDRTPLYISGGVLGIQILVFGGLGLTFLSRLRRQAQRREELVAGGYFETASVLRCEPVYSVTIGSRHPYVVVCRLERDGVLHEYKSEMLSQEPGLMPGDPVRVYLDRRDDNSYYVDVETAAPTIIRHG